MRAPRRQSTLWVRELTDNELHALAWYLQHTSTRQNLSRRQEWLWGRCVAELEWRRATTRPVYMRCSCELCCPPFFDLLPSESSTLGSDGPLH
jgi:hypothetical protein